MLCLLAMRDKFFRDGPFTCTWLFYIMRGVSTAHDFDPDGLPLLDRLPARRGANFRSHGRSQFDKQHASVPRPDIQPTSCLLALNSLDFQSVLRACTRTLYGAAGCDTMFSQSNTAPPVALLAVLGPELNLPARSISSRNLTTPKNKSKNFLLPLD